MALILFGLVSLSLGLTWQVFGLPTQSGIGNGTTITAFSGVNGYYINLAVAQGQGNICAQDLTTGAGQGCTTLPVSGGIYLGYLVNIGDQVQFTATPANGYMFDHFGAGGGGYSTQNPVTVAIIQAPYATPPNVGYVYAYFISGGPTSQVSISLSIAQGQGQICIADTTVASPSQCFVSSFTVSYPSGDAMRIRSSPASGYQFDHLVVNTATVQSYNGGGPDYYYPFTLTGPTQAATYFSSCSSVNCGATTTATTSSPVTVTIQTVQPSGGNGQVCVYLQGNLAQGACTITVTSVIFHAGDTVVFSAQSSGYFTYQYMTNPIGGQVSASIFSYQIPASSGPISVSAYFNQVATYTTATSCNGFSTGPPCVSTTTQNSCTFGYPYCQTTSTSASSSSFTTSTMTSTFTTSSSTFTSTTTTTFPCLTCGGGGNLWNLLFGSTVQIGLEGVGLIMLLIGIALWFIL